MTPPPPPMVALPCLGGYAIIHYKALWNSSNIFTILSAFLTPVSAAGCDLKQHSEYGSTSASCGSLGEGRASGLLKDCTNHTHPIYPFDGIRVHWECFCEYLVTENVAHCEYVIESFAKLVQAQKYSLYLINHMWLTNATHSLMIYIAHTGRKHIKHN